MSKQTRNSVAKQVQFHERGFALLLTLVVASVIMAIGLFLLNITMKQYILSVIARESERALHVANSGMECFLYLNHTAQRDSWLAGVAGTPSCGGVSPLGVPTSSVINAQTKRFLYTYQMNTNACFETSVYLYSPSGSGVQTQSIATYNEGLTSLSCRGGSTCTTIFSRGYNRPCGSRDSIYTVQRELTIQF